MDKNFNDVKSYCWEVFESESGLRLDVFCTRRLGNVSRSQLKSGSKALRVNSKLAKFSKKVFTGDKILLHYKSVIPERLELFSYPIKMVYEDKNIIVINKPSGMVTHIAAGHYAKTLVNVLENYRRFVSNYMDDYAKETINFDKVSARRGIVHRLDKDTSGLLLTVRNDIAKTFYLKQFKHRRVKKYYIAILDKPLPFVKGLIKTSIARGKKNRKKFYAYEDLTRGKIAYTQYKVLKKFGAFSLAVFRIFTGRTHQIRVHTKFLGSGIVGDSIYNKDKKNPLMLHAIQLEFTTQSGKILKLKTKMPKRFLDFYTKHKNPNNS